MITIQGDFICAVSEGHKMLSSLRERRGDFQLDSLTGKTHCATQFRGKRTGADGYGCCPLHFISMFFKT